MSQEILLASNDSENQDRIDTPCDCSDAQWFARWRLNVLARRLNFFRAVGFNSINLATISTLTLLCRLTTIWTTKCRNETRRFRYALASAIVDCFE